MEQIEAVVKRVERAVRCVNCGQAIKKPGAEDFASVEQLVEFQIAVPDAWIHETGYFTCGLTANGAQTMDVDATLAEAHRRTE